MLYQTNYETLKQSPYIPEECPNCNIKGKMYVRVIAKVTRINFIPMWMSDKKAVVHCDVCNYDFLPISFPKHTDKAEELYRESRYKWYYFSGSALFLILAGVLMIGDYINSAEKSKEEMEKLSNLTKNDVIIYTLDNGNYTSMKIDHITGNKIFVHKNKLSTNKDVYAIEKDTNYSQDETVYTLEQLKKMQEEEKIKEIYEGF